ncbi:MAG: penicillin-binding protein 2 [Pseudomonadota bacterium]
MELLRDFDSGPLEEEKRRLGLTMLVVVGLFGLLLLRLWFMQVINGGEYRQLSENNRVRMRDVQPCRGLVYDRNGVLLVDNRPCFQLCLVPEEAGDVQAVARRLAAVGGVPLEQIQLALEAAKGMPRFQAVTIVPDADRDLVAKVEMGRFDLPGIHVEIRPKRKYLYPALAPHLLGYLGEANEADLEGDERLRPGDFVGKYGVEMACQEMLAGVHGCRRVEVDACGREKRGLGEIKSRSGRSIQLTIDAALQNVACQSLTDKTGAVLAMDVRTGDVLVACSSPPFDCNAFVDGFDHDTWRALRDDTRHPLHNRCLQAAYPPGSTFKIIMALAALQEGVITPDTPIFCPGGYAFGHRTYRCWRKGGHGTVSLHRALVESCDVYFYRVGQALGIDRIARYAEAFGLGKPAGLGLGKESGGTVASRQWKMRRFKQEWYPGETISASIGQGYNTATPIQMLRVMAAVANGGWLVTPRVISGVEGEDGRIHSVGGPQGARALRLSKENIALVRDALVGVVQEGGGTAAAARSPLVSIGGKTGTAQVVRLPPGARQVLAERYRDHAWFVAFAPTAAPRLAVCALVEHGGHGGSAAAPLVRAVLEEAARRGYFGPPPAGAQVAAPTGPGVPVSTSPPAENPQPSAATPEGD